jgi:hypothetical protein
MMLHDSNVNHNSRNIFYFNKLRFEILYAM